MTIKFEDLKFHPHQFSISDCLITLEGPDAASYLHSQATSNIKSLKINEFQLSSLLDNSGKIVSSFIISKIEEDKFLISIAKKYLETTVERLEKFHISEEFEVKTKDCFTILSVNSGQDGILGKYFSNRDLIEFRQTAIENDTYSFRKFKILTGLPELGVEAEVGELINNTRFDELSVDYKKGCYPGQETVAKIETRRGAAFKPVLIISEKFTHQIPSKILDEGKKIGEIRNCFESEDKMYSYALLNREYRIDQGGLSFNFPDNDEIVSGIVHYYPFVDISSKSRAIELYDYALELFHEGKNTDAIEKLNKVIELDGTFEDAYESLGVIYGRIEEFDKAISLMEKLKDLNPKCMMAYTNLSLYHMKIGNIDTAEKFKSEATFLNFQLLGDEAKAKKEKAAILERKKAEAARRESMFKQVIDMDPEDAMANNGMGEIEFERENFELSVGHFEQAIKSDEKYSVAYLGLAKSLYQLNKIPEAKNILKEGIKVASKNGDLMPANEMQSILTTLD